MSGHPFRFPALPPILRVLSATVAVWLAATSPCGAQVGWSSIDLGTPDRLTLRRTGTFEVWRDSVRLGTEFYREWLTPARDSVIATSGVRYDIRNSAGAYLYQKNSVLVDRALNRYPIEFYAVDQYGEQYVSTRASFANLQITVYHEEGGSGRISALEAPAGRIAVLDANLYQPMESLASEFRDQGVPERIQQVFLPQQDTILRVRMVRGPSEKRTVPGWGDAQVDRVDLIDDWSVTEAWIDERGRLIELVAPARGLRVTRMAPGESEAKAAAISKGPPLPGNPPPPHLR